MADIKSFMLLLIILVGFIIWQLGKVNGYSLGCLDYGIMARDNLDGTCSCAKGYHFENKYGLGSTCVADPTCYDLYGFGAQDNYDGTCSCSNGYVRGYDIFGDKKCIDADKSCRDSFGRGSESAGNDGYCKCKNGYMMDTNFLGKKECVSGYTFCTEHHGIHSDYNYLLDGCECDNGYTLDENGKCVEKQNSAYFTLIELDKENNTAIIQSNYNGDQYDIEYNYGCYSISNYLGYNVVINMGYDFDVDFGDYLVLQDDDEVCTINDVNDYDENTAHIYKITGPNISMSNSIKNNELTQAISRLYVNGLTIYDTPTNFKYEDSVTREQAAKFFSVFNSMINNKTESNKYNCQFSDTMNADVSLILYINDACNEGIIKGSKGKFNPFGQLTKAQAIAILIRIIQGSMYEGGNFWYENYFNYATILGLLNGLNYNKGRIDNQPISRGDMALLINRGYNAIK